MRTLGYDTGEARLIKDLQYQDVTLPLKPIVIAFGVIEPLSARTHLSSLQKNVKFVTYQLQCTHRIHWYVKMEAFSSCVNGCVQRHQVTHGSGLKVSTFSRECHVLLLKVFDLADLPCFPGMTIAMQ